MVQHVHVYLVLVWARLASCPGAVWARDYTNTSDLFLAMRTRLKQQRYEVPRPSAIFGNSLDRAVDGEEECACEDKQTYSRGVLTGNSEWLNTPREIKVCMI